MKKPLPLHQELALLALNDSKGTFEGSMVMYGIGGAILSELILQDKIKVSDTKEQIVSIADACSTSDEVLDEALNMIVESVKPKGLQGWVVSVSGIKELHHRIGVQLCDLGVLKQDERKILWLFTQRIYPELDSSYEDEIRERMAFAMFKGKPADERTAVLIAFARSTHVLPGNFARIELTQHQDRIEEIAKGEILASGATNATIAAVQTAIMAATIASSVAATTAATS